MADVLRESDITIFATKKKMNVHSVGAKVGGYSLGLESLCSDSKAPSEGGLAMKRRVSSETTNETRSRTRMPGLVGGWADRGRSWNWRRR